MCLSELTVAESNPLEFFGHISTICCVCFSPDGEQIASGDRLGRIVLQKLDSKGGKRLSVREDSDLVTFGNRKGRTVT